MPVASTETDVPLEIGRTIGWRGQRWRILGLDDGFARLVGIDPATMA